MEAEQEELAVPLLARQDEADAEQEQEQEIRSAEPEGAQQGDLEQGLNTAGSEAGGSNTAEEEAAYEVSIKSIACAHVPKQTDASSSRHCA